MINLKTVLGFTLLALFISIAGYNAATSFNLSNATGITNLFNFSNFTGDNMTNIFTGNNVTNNFQIFNVTSNTTVEVNLSQGLGIFLNPNPITRNGTISINTSACNPANQASVFNGSGFECVSIADDDSAYIPFTAESSLNTNSSKYWGNLFHPLLMGESGQFLTSLGNGNTTWTRTAPSGSAITYFLHNSTDPAVPYSSKVMNQTFDVTSPKQFVNFTSLSNGNTFIQNWTSPEMNLTLIPAGVHTLHFDAKKIGGNPNKIIRLYYSCGIVNLTGENLSIRATSELSNEILSSETEVDMDMMMPDQDVNTTDKMIILVFANQTGAGLNPDLQLQLDNITDARLIFPAIPTDLTPILNNISLLQQDMNTKVNRQGDTMTGDLNMSGNSLLSVDVVGRSTPLLGEAVIQFVDSGDPRVIIAANLDPDNYTQFHQHWNFWDLFMSDATGITSEFFINNTMLDYSLKGISKININETTTKLNSTLNMMGNPIINSTIAGQISYYDNNQGSVIPVGLKPSNPTIYYNGSFRNIIARADVSGNFSVDVLKGNTTDVPAKIGSINITLAQNYQDSTFIGWTTTNFVENDNFQFNVTSVVNITRINIDLKTVRA